MILLVFVMSIVSTVVYVLRVIPPRVIAPRVVLFSGFVLGVFALTIFTLIILLTLTYLRKPIYNKPETETDTVGWPRAIFRPPETFHALLF